MVVESTKVKTQAPVHGGDGKICYAGAAVPAWCGGYALAMEAGAPRVSVRELLPQLFYIVPLGEGFGDVDAFTFSGTLDAALAKASEFLAAHLQALS